MTKKIYRSLWFASVCFFLITSLTAQAQKQTVTGKITDGTGSPLPGVNIILKGSTSGTTSDAAGAFSLEANSDDVLVISFIGYKTLEISVGNQTQIAVAMEEDISTLSEIVVVGYGEQKKALNTGSNFFVKGEDLQKLSTTNALQALQGQTPGVQITSTSGQPGSSMKVNIRGLGTLAGGNPLFVVDGVITGDISYLNNNDIERIDVLKDAASAAIYGSQSANGVVLVTTRKGKAGAKTQLTFDAFYGVQNVARKVDLLNPREYASIMNEQLVNSGSLPVFTNDEIAALDSGTNWMDKMFVKNAVTQNYSIGATGSSEGSVYSLGLSYTGQEGIVGGRDYSDYKRYNFRVNSEHKLFKEIVKIGENLTFVQIDNSGIAVGNQYNNTLRAAFNTSPLVPMYDAQGNFWDNTNSDWFSGEANPYAQMVYNNQNERSEQKVIGNIYVVVEPVKNLKLRSSFGLDYSASTSHSFTPIYQLSIYSYNNATRATQGMSNGHSWLWDNSISYTMQFGGHHIEALAGSSAYQMRGQSMFGGNSNLAFNDLRHAWLSNATNTDGVNISLNGGPWDEVNIMSYFGRVNYDFNEEFLLTATVRADGSSRFSAGNRWGYFPSFSAGWVLTNSDFFTALNSPINFLKLRAGWGQLGNQNIGNFNYLAPVTFANTNYIFGNTEGVLTPGAYVSRLSNAKAKWEAAQQVNVGIDAKLLQGALGVTIDWYNKTQKDWLIQIPVLATAGADAPYVNGGDVKNSGIELALTYEGDAGDLHYTISANGAYNKNKVTNIPTADGIIHGMTGQLFDNSGEFNRAQTGYPIGYFWGLQTDGIFQTEDEVSNYKSGEKVIQPNAKPGDVRYVDRDDNGVIDDLDRMMIGKPNPDYTFGFNIALNYKGFDFMVQGYGVTGNEIMQSYRNHANKYANYTTAILDRWHGPGSSNTMPRVTETSNNWINFSDLYIHDGSFLRISNVTVGYDLGRLLTNKFASQIRIYASALNLFTFTKYNGMDPEVGYGYNQQGYGYNSLASGVDVGYYPRPRTYMVGLNMKF